MESHKEVTKRQKSKNNFFHTIFACLWKDPDPYLWLMDPDPGGRKGKNLQILQIWNTDEK